MCYSAAPSTTYQNATRRIYIKDIKWLGKSLYVYNIKMQYENVFKVIGVVHIILAFLVLLLLLLKVLRRRLLRVLVLGSSGSSMSTHEHMAKNNAQHKHTSKQ